jgi:hypothetical protein
MAGYHLQRTDIGKDFFVNRTIKNWNHLPAEAVHVETELRKDL